MERTTTTNKRRAVCIMANELRRSGISLSEAFRKAWRRIKETMTIRAKGTTFENRQERLRFLLNFRPSELTITLEHEAGNQYDANAVAIVVHILPIRRRTVIGYIPRGLAPELVALMKKGIALTASLRGIIGGYEYKESLGMLLNIAV